MFLIHFSGLFSENSLWIYTPKGDVWVASKMEPGDLWWVDLKKEEIGRHLSEGASKKAGEEFLMKAPQKSQTFVSEPVTKVGKVSWGQHFTLKRRSKRMMYVENKLLIELFWALWNCSRVAYGESLRRTWGPEVRRLVHITLTQVTECRLKTTSSKSSMLFHLTFPIPLSKEVGLS